MVAFMVHLGGVGGLVSFSSLLALVVGDAVGQRLPR